MRSATATSKEAVSRSYTFSAESGKSAGSLQEEAEGRSTAAKAKKTAKERKRFEQFCERAAASIREQRNAGDAGSDIFDDGDGKHLVGLEFFDGISEQELKETLSITDADIRQGVRHTTANRVKKGILGSEGLLSVRRMIARMAQDTGSMAEAFEAVLAAIQKAVADKGRWLNDWNLIARRLAGELYSRGADRVAMTDDEGQSLPGKFRAADWNGVLAPSLFTAKGLAGLRKLIRTHGAEAVHDAVMEYLLRSKTDREIERAHVRNWAYFGKAIAEQTENEP